MPAQRTVRSAKRNYERNPFDKDTRGYSEAQMNAGPELRFHPRRYQTPGSRYVDQVVVARMRMCYRKPGSVDSKPNCCRCGEPKAEHWLEAQKWTDCDKPCGLCHQQAHPGDTCDKVFMSHASHKKVYGKAPPDDMQVKPSEDEVTRLLRYNCISRDGDIISWLPEEDWNLPRNWPESWRDPEAQEEEFEEGAFEAQNDGFGAQGYGFGAQEYGFEAQSGFPQWANSQQGQFPQAQFFQFPQAPFFPWFAAQQSQFQNNAPPPGSWFGPPPSGAPSDSAAPSARVSELEAQLAQARADADNAKAVLETEREEHRRTIAEIAEEECIEQSDRRSS